MQSIPPAAHAVRDTNAFYAPLSGDIQFGYDRVRGDVDARPPPGGYIFSCLSHDIIAHELSHALLHGLREQYLIPTRPDVPAFHEAFGDLVAIFQHFTYEEVVANAIAKCGADLDHAAVLIELARQFGYTTQDGPTRRALRTAIEVAPGNGAGAPLQYDKSLEPHLLGGVLVSAVFEAFVTLFRRKTVRHVRLATNGSGVLPPGAISHDLQKVLADEASQLASQILALCIRAIDYCPPVDLEFGDYLRALITADSELVADDRGGYREALVDSFGRRGIFPTDVGSLAEDSLRWRAPWFPIEIPELSFGRLQFAGDPARPAEPNELRKQADTLGRLVTADRYLEAFGLARPDPNQRDLKNPSIRSIRTARRVGPDGQVVFDLVAEISQERTMKTADGALFPFYGGATVIIDPEGQVRYSIVKNVSNQRRIEECKGFLSTNENVRNLWQDGGEQGVLMPSADLFRLVHGKSYKSTKG